MNKQVTMICKTGFYHPRNIAIVRKFLSHKHCEILIHAFVTSRQDFYNSILSGLPQYLIEKLQYVQNSAAHLFTGSWKYEHITPVLREQWRVQDVNIGGGVYIRAVRCVHLGGQIGSWVSEMALFLHSDSTFE